MPARLAAALAPAALTIYLAFNAGGFFAGSPAVAATVLGAALVLRILVAPDPFAGLGPGLVAAATFLGLFGVWTLVSSSWSDAPASAMIEFDRVLLYLMALLLFGSLRYDRRTLEWAVRALAGAIVVIATAALITRVLPEVWSAEAAVANDRLSFPLTYWNALGILIGVGLVLCVHLASATGESRLSRILAAAAVPLLAVTLYFTFSRGAILAALFGLVAYAVVARPKGLLSAAISVVPAVVVVLVVAYGADLLASGAYDSERGVEQGGNVALVAVLCVLFAGLVRLWLSASLDPRLDGWEPSQAFLRRTGAGVAAAVLVAVVVAVAAGVPGEIGDQYDRFTEGDSIDDSGDLRGRLTEIGNNGRLDQWRVAIDAFEAEPLRGEGAGTFPRIWARAGEEGLKVEDAHSLYIEVMAELGVVGLVLLGAGLTILLVGLGIGWRQAGSSTHAALLAAGFAWALHAGVDWDWEMPATGLWLFALSGMALSHRVAERSWIPVPPRFARLVLGAGALVLLITPAQMALSQGKLNDSLDALRAGDCTTASEEALAAARYVPARPQPFQILSYCNSRAGEHELALQMAETALDRDPGSWESLYGLALVRAAAGKDPRSAAAEALEANPNSPLTRSAVRKFDTEDAGEWVRRARSARLPIL